MVEVKLNFNTIAEAVAFLAGGTPPAGSATITPEKQQAARDSTAAGKATKPTKDAAAPAAAPTPSPTPAPAPAEDAKPAGPDRALVSAKVVELATKNQAAAVALMAKFGVAKARELKDDDLAAALKGAEEALSLLDMG